jgi:2-oxoglutarate ferredoxin oxidoreductase subunit delta
MAMKKGKRGKGSEMPSEPKPKAQVILYPAWCKRCGNCVAFCPRQVLERDEWGYPYVAHADRCISCHLCEMLCPDFAISVGEHPHPDSANREKTGTRRGAAEHGANLKQSPERVAPEPVDEEPDKLRA